MTAVSLDDVAGDDSGQISRAVWRVEAGKLSRRNLEQRLDICPLTHCNESRRARSRGSYDLLNDDDLWRPGFSQRRGKDRAECGTQSLLVAHEAGARHRAAKDDLRS